MPTRLWVFLVLLLAAGMPLVGSGSAQSSNMTASEIIDLVRNSTDAGNTTDLDNATGILKDSPFVNDTESSDPGATNIVINEVELNPQGSDIGRQWIELYNPAGVEVNISDFEIRTSFKSATIRLPPDAAIDANGTYIVELDGKMLSNTAESLVLVNASGEIIDRTPSLVDRSDDGRTWQRIPDGNSEWQFAEGTRDELNDPDEQVSSTYTARAGSAAQCLGTAGCAEGIVTRIVDSDTFYVNVNNTVYKIDLALTSAPSSAEKGFSESRLFTRNLCFGSSVLIDQDDRLLTSESSVIAVVYCGSTNLNSELLSGGYATQNTSQCQTSEFASQPWARQHGC
ncbi:MAG TPA: lamin tail domain-containing protein [Nitrososphaera sp.]|nr:lamin tail domain-containing protein [Nitrososphaera sp.]